MAHSAPPVSDQHRRHRPIVSNRRIGLGLALLAVLVFFSFILRQYLHGY